MKPEILIKEGKIYLAIEGQKYESVLGTKKRSGCSVCALNDPTYKGMCNINTHFNSLKGFKLKQGKEIIPFKKVKGFIIAKRADGSNLHFSCSELGYLAGSGRESIYFRLAEDV